MGYWKSKVLPKIKKVFEKNTSKKAAAAAEACKSFDDSKEEINKEFEEKKTELQPKVVQVYEASPTEIKTLVKEPTEAGVKKNATAVQTFLEELVKIEFPGSKQVSEASSNVGGPVLVSGPVVFVLEKVSSLVAVTDVTEEEKPTETTTREREVTTTTETATETDPEPETIITTKEEETGVKDKEITIEEEKEKLQGVQITEPVAAAPTEETTSINAEKTETTPTTTEPAAPVSSESEPTNIEEAKPPKVEQPEPPKA